jgi:hypothetical protein
MGVGELAIDLLYSLCHCSSVVNSMRLGGKKSRLRDKETYGAREIDATTAAPHRTRGISEVLGCERGRDQGRHIF